MIRTKNAEKIHQEITKKIKNGASYIDALVEYSKENDMEIETLGNIVKKSPIMKSQVKDEAEKIKMIRYDKDDPEYHDKEKSKFFE